MFVKVGVPGRSVLVAVTEPRALNLCVVPFSLWAAIGFVKHYTDAITFRLSALASLAAALAIA